MRTRGGIRLPPGRSALLWLAVCGCSSGGGGGGEAPIPAPPLTLVDLQVTGITHEPGSVNPGQTLQVWDEIRNAGNAPAGGCRVGIYASMDPTITPQDTLLGYRNVSSLAAGGVSGGSGQVTINLAPGTWYIGAFVDDQGRVAEGSDANNSKLSTTHTSRLTVAAPPSMPDLVVSSLTHNQTTVVQGQTLAVADSVKNEGAGQAGSFRVAIYASTDSVIEVTDTLLGERIVSTLGPGAVNSGGGSFPIGLPSGTWWIGAIADYTGTVAEASETNNSGLSTTNLGRLTVTPMISTTFDLSFTSLTHGANSVEQGQSVSVTETVRNTGNSTTGAFRVGIYLSPDSTITTADTRIGFRTVASLGAGAVSTDTASLMIGVSPGTYFVGGIVDYENAIVETDENNNTVASSFNGGVLVVTQSPTPLPDLVVSALTHSPGSVLQGGSVAFNDTVLNQGNGPASTNFRVGIYISSDNVITTSDTPLGQRTIGSLASQATSSSSATLTIPSSLPPGTYWIGAFVDYPNWVVETNENNNTRLSSSSSSQLVVTPPPPPNPDLVVSALTHSPTSVQPGQTVSINDTVFNQGGAANTGFRVGYYLSSNSTISTSDTLLGYRSLSSLGSQATSSSYGMVVTIPSSTATVTWWIGAIVDYEGVVGESNESNNATLSSSDGGQLVVNPVPTYVDLVVTNLTHTPSSLQAGSMAMTVNFVVRNQGTGAAGAFRVGIYASSNNTIGTGDTLLEYWNVSSLAANTQTTLGGSITVQIPPGTWYVGAWADDLHVVSESNENNNTYLSGSFGSQFTASGPDLIGTSVTHSAGSILSGSPLTVNYSITNQGSSDYRMFRIGVYLSTSNVISTIAPPPQYDTLFLGLGSGSSYSNSRTITPQSPGTYWVGIYIDYLGAIDETHERNNTRLSSSWSGQVIVL